MATTTAELDIQESSITFVATVDQRITIQLKSGGAPIAAPAGGLAVTLVSANPACAGIQSNPVTIGAGLVAVPATIEYGGTAALPCTATVTASGPAGVTTDAVSVTVNPAPKITPPSAQNIGAGMMTNSVATLGFGNHGGVTVTIASGNPAVLLALNQTSAGAAFIERSLANGQTQASYYMHCLEGTAGQSATITISAPGFTSATHQVNCVTPLIKLLDTSASYASLAPDVLFRVQVGIGSGGGTGFINAQNLRFGGPGATATVAVSDATVARLKGPGGQIGNNVTIAIPAGASETPYDGATGLSLDPLTTGSLTLSFGAPGFTNATTGSSATTITITGQGITPPSAQTVAAGMKTAAVATLGASQHGGVTVRITSSNPEMVLVSPNAATLGAAFVDIPVNNGQTQATFTIHAVSGAGGNTITLTYEALGFTNATSAVTVIP